MGLSDGHELSFEFAFFYIVSIILQRWIFEILSNILVMMFMILCLLIHCILIQGWSKLNAEPDRTNVLDIHYGTDLPVGTEENGNSCRNQVEVLSYLIQDEPLRASLIYEVWDGETSLLVLIFNKVQVFFVSVLRERVNLLIVVLVNQFFFNLVGFCFIFLILLLLLAAPSLLFFFCMRVFLLDLVREVILQYCSWDVEDNRAQEKHDDVRISSTRLREADHWHVIGQIVLI